MLELRERLPQTMRAIGAGTLERVRIGQPLSTVDRRMIQAMPTMTARHLYGRAQLEYMTAEARNAFIGLNIDLRLS